MKKQVSKKMISDLKAGDRIMIVNEPKLWSSALNDTCPLDGKVKFPHVLTIKKIRKCDDYYVDMTCGKYGWDLDAIVEASCYLLDRENDEVEDLIEVL